MQKNQKAALYVVGTPIGNLSDFSPRAQDTLCEVDFIAAEDTRITAKLLNHFGIKKPTLSYFEHNKKEHGALIVSRILNGETCALVTDAGMPAISDPGEDLVALCRQKGIQVYVVPGPTAVISALAISGLPTSRFTFEGFLSMDKKIREDHLISLIFEKRTMVFYEAPHKLKKTLSDLLRVLGDRKVAVVREITKVYEETLCITLSEANAVYQEKEPRGEYVLVIKGDDSNMTSDEMTMEDAVAFAREQVQAGKPATEAAKAAAKLSGFRKSDIYRELIILVN